MTTPEDPRPSHVGTRRGPFVGAGESSSARAQYARRLAGVTEDNPALDRVAGLAAYLTGAASAQVSIIAEEQTVVGGAGAAAGSVGAVSPAEESLCTVTVRANAPVLVTDASGDDRVSHLPPVTTGAVGSYLGVPLVTAGHTVGALCVFDDAPRVWSAQDVEMLQRLAGPVLAELELAALSARYDDDRLLWQLAIDAAGVGVFDWDLASGELRWDEMLLELFGLTRETFGGTIEAFNAAVHPEDQARVAHALDEAIRTCGTYAAEYRVLLPGGGIRWVSARGQALAGEEGVAGRVLGAAFDTTAVQEGEARVARVLEAMPSAFFQLDTDWRFTYANAEAERLLGDIGVPVVGESIWELFPAALGSEFETHYRRAVETGQPVEFEAYYPPPLDDWYEVRAWPVPDGLSVYFLKITSRRVAEETIARTARRAAFLAEVTRALSETLDAEEAVARLARLVVPVFGDWCLITLAEGSGPVVGPTWRHRLRDIGAWHHDPDRRELVDRYARARMSALTDDSYVARALAGDVPIVVPDRATESIGRMLDDGEARRLLAELAPAATIAVPLRGRGHTIGLLSVFRGADREPLSEEELEILTETAARAGAALDNARAFSQQRDLAEGLQRILLTAPPDSDHLQIVVRYEPAAEAAQVGGDWYDAFLQPDGATNLVIGDVVGHDTAAAAAMGQIRGMLRGIAGTTGAGPADVLRRLDEAMRTLRVDTMATAIVARLEQTPEEHAAGVTRLRWSNAGHPPPIVVIPGDAPEATGAPVTITVLEPARSELLLGLHPTTERTDSVVTVPRGATVVLYTDGLVERRGQLIDDGIARLREVLAELVADGVGLEDLADQLLRRLLPENRDDDVALVVVRLFREDRPRPPEAGPVRVPTDVPVPPTDR